jgi:hypothetical protein
LEWAMIFESLMPAMMTAASIKRLKREKNILSLRTFVFFSVG